MDYTFAANLAPCLLDILRNKDPRSPIADHEYHKNTDGLLINVTLCYYPIRPQNLFITFFVYSSVR